jgi:hypothetical protein
LNHAVKKGGTMMTDNSETLAELLKDSIFINAVIATELIQLVENSSRQIRGNIPESCVAEHRQLKERIVRIAEKWNAQSDIIRKHSLNHD